MDNSYLENELKKIQYRLQQLENQKMNNYCKSCKSLNERISDNCYNCNNTVCKHCRIVKEGNKIYCPRNCCK